MTINLSAVHAISLTTSSTLKTSSYGEDVFTLQTMLNKCMNTSMIVDGKFGSNTYNQVINFQQKYQLEADGIVGPATREKLNQVYQAKKKNKVLILSDGLSVQNAPGESNSVVGNVKQGKVFQIYATKKIGNTPWYKIKYDKTNKKYGYINGASSGCTTTFIIVDISQQYLSYYKNGKPRLYTPIATRDIYAFLPETKLQTVF